MIDTTYDRNSDYEKQKRDKKRIVNLIPDNDTQPPAQPAAGKVTMRYSNNEPLFAMSLDPKKRRRRDSLSNDDADWMRTVFGGAATLVNEQTYYPNEDGSFT